MTTKRKAINTDVKQLDDTIEIDYTGWFNESACNVYLTFLDTSKSQKRRSTLEMPKIIKSYQQLLKLFKQDDVKWKLCNVKVDKYEASNIDTEKHLASFSREFLLTTNEEECCVLKIKMPYVETSIIDELRLFDECLGLEDTRFKREMYEHFDGRTCSFGGEWCYC